MGFDFAYGIAGAAGKELFDHGHGHGLGGGADAQKAAFFCHAVFPFGIGLFAATGDDDLDAVDALGLLLLLHHHIKQAHGGRGDVVFDAVFHFEHVAIHISHSHTLAGFVDADVDQPTLAGIEKGDDFFLKVEFGREFTLVFDAVVFSHGQRGLGLPVLDL